jgi:SNF2 family DNA or RNA helicase
LLTRPLVYKGPTDHLTQYFSVKELYQGIQILLADGLMDWQQQKEEKQIQGVFFSDGKLIKTFVAWPLSSINSVSATSVNTCGCLDGKSNPSEADVSAEVSASATESCVHIAALAIETKTRLDRLPPPIKQTETFHSEWQYLTDWLGKQSYDPFPNMARHRVIYLFDQIDGNLHLTLHKAYLTQQQEFQKKAELDLKLLYKDKLPKFVSQTDQQIMHQLNQLQLKNKAITVAKNELNLSALSELQKPELGDLLKKIVGSHRSFWRSCHRQPLSFNHASKIHATWLPLGEELYLDKHKSQLVDANPIVDDVIDNFLQQAEDNNNQFQPVLKLSSHSIALPWSKQSVEIDAAQLSFKVAGTNYESQPQVTIAPLLAYVFHSSKRNSSQLLEQIAAKIHRLDGLKSIHSNFEQPVSQYFDPCDRFLDGNFAHWMPLLLGLSKDGWKIEFDKSFRLNQKSVDRWYSKVSSIDKNNTNKQLNSTSASGHYLQEETSWFDLEVGIHVDGQAVNLMPYIVKALQQGLWDLQGKQSDQPLHLTLDDGTRIELAYGRVKNILNTLLELFENKPLTEQDQLRLPSNQFGRLLHIEQQTDEALLWQESDWLKTKVQSLRNGQGIVDIEKPINVHAKLRDYQQQGLNWLQFLAQQELGGILADDMGLGKTLQTLAHIQIEKNQNRMQGPCLVVAPTSLLGNWFAEAAKFTPDLNCVYWAGSKRHQTKDDLSKADLIITSYGLLLRDAELLNQQNIHLLILDEAQAIKNARSKISKIAFTLQSKLRLCLTGTPLENHLGELWSLFHFLMPGFLGDENQFKQLFRIPIEKEQSAERQKELADRVMPFMLRRTKDKVAADLPAKTVIEEVIELAESQADIYESVRISMFEEVQTALARSSTGASSGRNQLLIGNALLRLRQICCHPQLIAQLNVQQNHVQQNQVKQEQEQAQADLFEQKSNALMDPEQSETNAELKKIDEAELLYDSAKLKWLKTKLPEMIINGRKILIFSSFTSMLSIIEKELKNLSIDHLTLTGKTKNRAQLVKQFQQGDIPVFLISLKAGGSGLNLTEADTVIHFDPWWNPAAENQASDRAHRIGQDKPVFVYKLITKGTVEERINQMQQQKSVLAEELYRRSENRTEIERPDWKALLAPLGEVVE